MSDANAPADDQRTLRILLAILGAVAVLALLWFFVVTPLILGDDASDDPTADRAAPVQPTPTESVDPGSEAVEDLAALPVETYEIFLSRDPFDPVVPAAAGEGSDADGDGVADGGADGGGDGGDDGGSDGSGSDGGTDDGDGDGTPQHDAVLIDVFVDDSGETRALVRVGDRIYTVGEGDSFADGYVVDGISGTCISLEYRGASFTLCEGGGGTGDPGGTPGGPGSGAGSGACADRDGEVVCEGRTVTLIDVYTSGGEAVAVVQVDSTLYEVRRGDDFAGNFRVVSIDPPCATLLYGDDAFTLCEGQQTLK